MVAPDKGRFTRPNRVRPSHCRRTARSLISSRILGRGTLHAAPLLYCFRGGTRGADCFLTPRFCRPGSASFRFVQGKGATAIWHGGLLVGAPPLLDDHLPEQVQRLTPACAQPADDLHNIHPSLALLRLPHIASVPLQGSGQVPLGQLGLLTSLSDQVAQHLVHRIVLTSRTALVGPSCGHYGRKLESDRRAARLAASGVPAWMREGPSVRAHSWSLSVTSKDPPQDPPSDRPRPRFQDEVVKYLGFAATRQQVYDHERDTAIRAGATPEVARKQAEAVAVKGGVLSLAEVAQLLPFSHGAAPSGRAASESVSAEVSGKTFAARLAGQFKLPGRRFWIACGALCVLPVFLAFWSGVILPWQTNRDTQESEKEAVSRAYRRLVGNSSGSALRVIAVDAKGNPMRGTDPLLLGALILGGGAVAGAVYYGLQRASRPSPQPPENLSCSQEGAPAAARTEPPRASS